MTVASVPPISYNQIGQKLGRKGQETRERILAAMLRLLAEPDGPPVTLSGVAKEARVRPPNLYLYFPDMGELLLAVLSRVMDSAEEAYLVRLRQRWSDAALGESCLDFLLAYFAFWQRHARLLHMRNAMADAKDLRVLRYRNEATVPLIDLLAQQIGSASNASHSSLACVLLTGLERVATVVTNPLFRVITSDFTAGITDLDQQAYVRALIEAEAEVISVVITHRRALASQTQRLQAATR